MEVHPLAPSSSRTICSCKAEEGICGCEKGKCACASCPKNTVTGDNNPPVSAEKAELHKSGKSEVDVGGGEKAEVERTQCNCGADGGKCACEPGKCACGGCGRNVL